MWGGYGRSSGDDPHPDDVLVADADLLEGLVVARLELLTVQRPDATRRRVEVGVLLGVGHDEPVPEVTPGHRPGGPEAGRGAEPHVLLEPQVDELVVPVELLAGAGREVVGADALDGHGAQASDPMWEWLASSCQVFQLLASTEPLYSPLSPSSRPYQASTSGRAGPPQLPWSTWCTGSH